MKFKYNNPKVKSKRKKLRHQMTIPEIFLWSKIRNKKLGYKFRRQYSIGRFIVDFYCPELRLVIELDGSQHLELRNILYDKKRTKYFNSLSIKVIRFFNNEVLENIEGVYMRIEDEINGFQHLNPNIKKI